MDHWVYQSEDEQATAALGRALAELLPEGSVVALCGTLGAGKTRLVQAVAEACGIDPRDVLSPGFVLVHEYPGRRMVYHLDAYRIASQEEFLELGPEEYFAKGSLTLVEWADRVAGCLPPEHLEVRIEVTGEHSRRFELVAHGVGYCEVLGRLGSLFSSAK
ncbi:MAG: tRNA (adenosine(37)-N6)-threonylcarbamoyltransferase complex ATPase subunit type 1 TsaE [Thermoguttaceae bacterium]